LFDIYVILLYTPSMSENKMGTMPVSKLIINISLPMVFSMFVQALYNIVDSIFVAQINEQALTAVSLAFPVQNLMTAVGIGTAVGVNALLSTRLGQNRQEEVDKSAINGLYLAVCNFIVFFILGLFIIRPYLRTQTSDTQIIEYGVQYLNVVVLGSFGLFVVVMLDRILQGTGLTFYTMISQLCGAVTNIVFDPILIFGLGPFPKLGMTGAAIATIFGQFISMFLSFGFNIKKNKEVHFHFRGFRPDRHIIREIYTVGVPAILLNAITSLTTYLINLILGIFSTTAIAVYGVYFKLNSFLFMPLFGLNNGLVPIIAYNYGAENKRRIKKTIRTGLIYGIGIMVFGTIVFELFPKQLLRLFAASDEMLTIGVPALRIIALGFVGAAVAITLSSVFQAFSNAVYSMIVSFARQIIVLLPVAYLLGKTGKVYNVWWAFPIAEVASVSISLFMMARINRKKISILK
jgi:putative MATE family efflux protein